MYQFSVCAIDVRRLSKAKPIWLDDELCMRRADIKRTNNLCSSIEQNIENMVQESTTPTYNWIFKTNLSMLSAHIAEIDCMNHNGIDRWCCCCVTDSNIIGDVALWLFGKNENAWQKHLLLVYLRFHSRSFSIRMLDVMGAWKNIPALLMLFACAMLFQCVAVAVSLCRFAWVCGGRFVCVRSAYSHLLHIFHISVVWRRAFVFVHSLCMGCWSVCQTSRMKSNVIYENENKPKRRKSVDELRWMWTDVHFSNRVRFSRYSYRTVNVTFEFVDQSVCTQFRKIDRSSYKERNWKYPYTNKKEYSTKNATEHIR